MRLRVNVTAGPKFCWTWAARIHGYWRRDPIGPGPGMQSPPVRGFGRKKSAGSGRVGGLWPDRPWLGRESVGVLPEASQPLPMAVRGIISDPCSRARRRGYTESDEVLAHGARHPAAEGGTCPVGVEPERAASQGALEPLLGPRGAAAKGRVQARSGLLAPADRSLTQNARSASNRRRARNESPSGEHCPDIFGFDGGREVGSNPARS